MIREYTAKEVIAQNGSVKLWEDAIWINHKHHTYFVPIWRNASSSFLFNIAEQYDYKLVSLPKNDSWTLSYTGYTFIRYPSERFLGQLSVVSKIYNCTIEESIEWWLSNREDDVHMKTQCSFLEGLEDVPLHYIDADNIRPIGHKHIDNVLETFQNTTRYNDISKQKEELKLQLKKYKAQIKEYYLEDYKLFKENIK